MSNKISIVVDDMFFAAKIRAAAGALAYELDFVKSLEKINELASDPPSLVIVDLNSARLNPLEAISLLKSQAATGKIPVVGFLSHVQTELKEDAERAGYDYVIPRSLFSMKLTEILAGNFESLPKPAGSKR